MFTKFTLTDKLLFISAFLSLIFSEVLYFKGEANAAIFIGLWVPSILAFGIYLKLINSKENDWNNTIFRRAYYTIICIRLFIGIKRNEKTKKLIDILKSYYWFALSLTHNFFIPFTALPKDGCYNTNLCCNSYITVGCII